MAEQVELDISIAALKKDLADLQKELVKTGQAGDAAFTGVTKEVDALSQEVKKLAAVQREASAAVQQTDKATGGFGAMIKNAISNTQVFGKSIGEWQGQLSGAASGLLNTAKSSGAVQTAIRGIGFAIKASGIGLLIGIVASLIGYFTRFQSGIDKVSRVMASVSAVSDVLIGRFLKLGSSVLNFVVGIGKFETGDATGAMESFGQAADDASAAVSGLAQEVVAVARAAALLEKEKQQFRDFQSVLEKRTAQREAEADAAKRIADDDRRSNNTRIAALQTEGKLRVQIAQDELENAKERQRLALRDLNLNEASRDDAEKRQAAQEAAIEVIKAGGKVQEAIFQNEKQIRDFRKQAAEERQNQLKKEADDLEKLKKDLDKLRVEGEAEGLDKDLAEVNRKYDALIETAQNGVAKLNEIERRRGLTPEEQAQRREFAALTVTLEERRTDALLGVLTDYAEKDIEIEKELREQKEALAQGDYDRAVQSLEREKKLREQQIAIGEESAKAFIARLKQQGASVQEIEEAQREFDLLAQQARLRAELDFNEKLLEITATVNPERAVEIKKQIELLKAQLANVDFQIETPEPGKKKTLLDLLGIDPGNQDDFKEAVGQSIDLLQQLGEARLAEAQAAVDAAEAKEEAAQNAVEAAKDALDRELELAELGFASNVSLRQQELADAQAAQAEAEKQKQAAIANQQKTQRQQIILDSILQASNLITSSTNVIKGFSAIPIVGVPLGIAAVALMIGAFIKSKIAAIQAVNSTKFRAGGQGRVRDDGVIVGPSHEHGGVIVPEYEGGEFFTSDGKRFAVVNRKMTHTHFDLLQAVNKDDRPAMVRYMERLTGGVARDTEATEAVVESVRNTVIVGQGRDAKVERLLEENNALFKQNNALTKKLLDLESEREQVFDMGDFYLKIKNGRETRVRKRG